MREPKVFGKMLSLPVAAMLFPHQLEELARDLLKDADDADEMRERINSVVDELFPGGCPPAEYFYRLLELWKVKHGIAFRTTRDGDRILWMPHGDWDGAHVYTADGWQQYVGEVNEEPVEHVAATPAPPAGPYRTHIAGPWPY